MPYTSPRTGIIWPNRENIANNFTDVFETLTDPGLQRSLRVVCTTTRERDERFPSTSLGAGFFPCALITSTKEEHQWDGTRWVVSDLSPKAFAPSLSYLSADGTTGSLSYDAAGGGSLAGKFLRQAGYVDWKIVLVRGTNAWVGGTGGGSNQWIFGFNGAFTVESADAIGPSSAFINTSGSLSQGVASYRVGGTGATILLANGTRVGADTRTWSGGERILLAGRAPLAT